MTVMISDSPGFYAPWPDLGTPLSKQWPTIRENFDALAPTVKGLGISWNPSTQNLQDGAVAYYTVGEGPFFNRFRMYYDPIAQQYDIQANEGTVQVPIWVTMFIIDYNGGNVTIPNGLTVQGGFYGPFPTATIRVSEAGVGAAAVYPKVHDLKFNLHDFYLTSDTSGNPVVNAQPTSATNIVSARASFSAATQWIWNHNLNIDPNSVPVIAVSYDTNYQPVIPDKLRLSDPNTAYFYFLTPLKGAASIFAG